MKNNSLFFVVLMALFQLAQAQDVVRVCGTEPVTLRAGNFQYGTIQWERSPDDRRWEAIPGANDTTYTFTPEKDMYYRSVASFSECPQEVSETAFVQMPPEANAGFDRVSPGNEIRLTANTTTSSEGVWQIIAGSGGSLSDNTNPLALFQGTDSLYTLVWTLTNACGTDADTVQLRYRQNEYIESLAIVDDTDQVLSDSLQMEKGLYIIRFSDPAPEITEETILAGITRGGFLRRVESFTVDGDTYSIQTSQANLEDITINGAYNLAFAFDIDTIIGPHKMHPGMTRLHKKPTRKELTTNPMYKNGIYYYIIDDEPAYVHPGVTLEKRDKDEETTISLTFERTLLEENGVTMTLTGGYSFTPNFVADLEYSGLNLTYFKMGLSNAEAVRSVDLTLSASVTALSLEKTFTLLSLKRDMIFVVGTVPLLITAGFSIEGEATASVGASMDITQGFTNTTYYDAYIEYTSNKWGYVFDEDSDTETNSSLQINGSIEQHFEIGPRLSLTVYRLVGPYIDLRLEQDFELCTDFNYWQTNMNIGGSLTLGAKAEILSWTLIDISRKWTQGFYHYQFPHQLDVVSGNNQTYAPGIPLFHPVKIRVKSNKSLILPGARVKFEPQNGGSVSQSMVTANAAGDAETLWTPGGAAHSTLKVTSKDCEGNNVSLSPMLINAYAATSVTDCTKSSLSLNIVKDDQIIRPQVNMGYPPYTFSTDGVSYSAPIPEVTPVTGNTYLFYVKDADGCISSASWTEQAEVCQYNGLALDLQTIGNTVIAFAKGGSPPYLFSIDGFSGNFSPNNYFVSLTVGDYAIFVKDSNGCIKKSSTIVFQEQHPNCGVLVDARDGNAYRTVQIGSQCWMADNLRYLPAVAGAHAEWVHGEGPNYSVYGYYGSDDPVNSVDIAMEQKNYLYYGVLYNWAAAMAEAPSSDTNPSGVQGVCPAGWHLPSDAEWKQLVDFAESQGFPNLYDEIRGAGSALKSCRRVDSPLGGDCNTSQHPRWDKSNTPHHGMDDFGFSAFPGGMRRVDGVFVYLGQEGLWWSTTERYPKYSWVRSIFCSRGDVHHDSANKNGGISIRCVRD